MIFFLTTLAALMVIAISLVLASFRHPPKYHTDQQDFIRLLQLILSGQANYEDWSDIMHQPVRHDDRLEALRRQCLQVEEKHFTGLDGQLGHPERMIHREGLEQLAELLRQLKQLSS